MASVAVSNRQLIQLTPRLQSLDTVSIDPCNYIYQNPELETIVPGWTLGNPDLTLVEQYLTDHAASNPSFTADAIANERAVPSEFQYRIYLSIHERRIHHADFNLYNPAYTWSDPYTGNTVVNTNRVLYKILLEHNPLRLAIIHFIRLGRAEGLATDFSTGGDPRQVIFAHSGHPDLKTIVPRINLGDNINLPPVDLQDDSFMELYFYGPAPSATDITNRFPYGQYDDATPALAQALTDAQSLSPRIFSIDIRYIEGVKIGAGLATFNGGGVMLNAGVSTTIVDLTSPITITATNASSLPVIAGTGVVAIGTTINCSNATMRMGTVQGDLNLISSNIVFDGVTTIDSPDWSQLSTVTIDQIVGTNTMSFPDVDMVSIIAATVGADTATVSGSVNTTMASLESLVVTTTLTAATVAANELVIGSSLITNSMVADRLLRKVSGTLSFTGSTTLTQIQLESLIECIPGAIGMTLTLPTFTITDPETVIGPVFIENRSPDYPVSVEGRLIHPLTICVAWLRPAGASKLITPTLDLQITEVEGVSLTGNLAVNQAASLDGDLSISGAVSATTSIQAATASTDTLTAQAATVTDSSSTNLVATGTTSEYAWTAPLSTVLLTASTTINLLSALLVDQLVYSDDTQDCELVMDVVNDVPLPPGYRLEFTLRNTTPGRLIRLTSNTMTVTGEMYVYHESLIRVSIRNSPLGVLDIETLL